MKGKDLIDAIDFKKLTVVELHLKFEELKNKYPEKKKIVFVTQSAMIEAELKMVMDERPGEEPILENSLTQYEVNPAIDIKDKEILNSTACIYLHNVKLTPFSLPGSPIHLDEFILFSDHLLGITTS
ncbi:hypothetical protein ACOJQI_11255 [Bacillus salacetis]|uniref:hypothetical protein n=1 Tax=Bacillus salacetis TaxID=2315464 RepID=UPI003BA204DF